MRRPPDAERAAPDRRLAGSDPHQDQCCGQDTSALRDQLGMAEAKAGNLGAVIAAGVLHELDVDDDLLVEILRAVDDVARHVHLAAACAS